MDLMGLGNMFLLPSLRSTFELMIPSNHGWSTLKVPPETSVHSSRPYEGKQMCQGLNSLFLGDGHPTFDRESS